MIRGLSHQNTISRNRTGGYSCLVSWYSTVMWMFDIVYMYMQTLKLYDTQQEMKRLQKLYSLHQVKLSRKVAQNT